MNQNEVALVTGGNKGIGHEIVRQLASRGFTVYLGARNAARGTAAAAGLSGDVRFVQLDVTDVESVAAAAKQVDADSGRLDVLVNNAGVVAEWGTSVADITAEQVRTAYDVNVFGVVSAINAFVPLLRRSPNARIVNMSSGLGSMNLLSELDGRLTTQGLLAYSSSKAALNALTLVYASALRADGIKVNAATPGLVPTDLNTQAAVPRGTRTVADGAAVPVALATLPADGPTGVFRGPGSLDDVAPW
ncbi:NAD(P)-dependent dehydrogenase (short-subunit alcohol dehydrogenase family) [Kribbella aluminosa]|uniref:NAD(P)-dependent dehydrogenase (Short-subunit alcohol dehydrogenase family) n=1 Tax=Kribbella aluminosa TaxID=416017 RepID=A0ABS4UZQ1_9ACTN|nr:SDR family NAD(P)-dependent oxidoreductase [Kribbella aluminosa]MBP2357009.1 NAD(P)-dependent dehydrogenase (short-subunit alcohol dehydrogenase family) [Kribbella aluminosa]